MSKNYINSNIKIELYAGSQIGMQVVISIYKVQPGLHYVHSVKLGPVQAKHSSLP